MAVNPLTIGPEEPLRTALDLMEAHRISGVPVVESGTERLVGILTNRDVRFASVMEQPARELMTAENLVTVRENVTRDEAKRLLHHHRIEKLLVVDGDRRLKGLITVTRCSRPSSSRERKRVNFFRGLGMTFRAGFEVM